MLFVSIMQNENRHPDEIRVRRQLEGTLRGKFHETMWKSLHDVVCECLDGELEFPALRDLAEEMLKRQREHERELREMWGLSEEPQRESSGNASDTVPGERSQPIDVELPEREKKRADVLLEVQIRRAAEHPDVKNFRNKRLGGRLLSAEEAEAYFHPGPRGGITDEGLADLGQRLRHHYGWHQDDAVWFVLTGELPTLRPLEVSFFDQASVFGPSYAEITLHVAPWVPPEEVKQAFLRARDQVRGDAGPGTVSKQRLEVLRFVEEENAKGGQQPALSALFEIWNQKYPRFAYADYRAFSKAYRQARGEVLYPEYHTPQRKETPNMERQKVRNQKWLEAIRKRDAARHQSP